MHSSPSTRPDVNLYSNSAVKKFQQAHENTFRDLASKNSMPVGVDHDQLFVLGAEPFIHLFAPLGMNNRIV
jgi:hypothetical protein